jgi:hypothetical protein
MILGLTDAAALAALLLAPGTLAPAPQSGALLNSAPPVLDRYGAPAPSPPPDVTPASWRSGRRLVWPGKTPPPDAAGQPPAALDAPKDAATAPTVVPASAPIAAAALAGPAAAPPERRVDGPRFYSLHRDYGLAPDAIPLPPKFFGPTADLSKPPEPAIIRLGDNRPALTAQSEDDPAGERTAAP